MKNSHGWVNTLWMNVRHSGWTGSLWWCTTNEPGNVAQVMGLGFSASPGRERQERGRWGRRGELWEGEGWGKEIMTEPSMQANGNHILLPVFLSINSSEVSHLPTPDWLGRGCSCPTHLDLTQWAYPRPLPLAPASEKILQKRFLLTFSTVPYRTPYPCHHSPSYLNVTGNSHL